MDYNSQRPQIPSDRLATALPPARRPAETPATLLLASCATERYAPAFDTKVDSALSAAGLPPLAVLKLTGPVTIQVGQGNNSRQVGTNKTGQRARVGVRARGPS